MHASRHFGPRAAQVRAARVFAAGTAQQWGMDPADVEVVVGELAANAYVHARSEFTVSLRCHDDRISIEVEDRSPAMPRVSGHPGDGQGGRGLVLVEAIAATWGAREVGAGKVVWAEVVARAATRGRS